MITDLWIENFKGIGRRQHIPLRPITLLFGANSAGKSTVLHALMYLREILCNRNLNPTRSIAGDNTVNLGGLQQLIHKMSEENEFELPDEVSAESLTLGCRFLIYPENHRLHQNPLSEKSFYAFQVSTYTVGGLDENVDHPSVQPTVEYEDYIDSLYSNTLWLRICPEKNAKAIDSFEWHVNDEPFISSWKCPSGATACWINPFHNHLEPIVSSLAPSSADSVWHSILAQHLDKLLLAIQSDLESTGRALTDIHTDGKYAVFFHPLICPQWDGRIDHFVSALFNGVHGKSHVDSIISSTCVNLSEFVKLCPSTKLCLRDWEQHTEGVYLGFNPDLLSDAAANHAEALLFVAVPENLLKAAEEILERIRFLWTSTALAGNFLRPGDDVGFMDDRMPILDITDEIGALHGASKSHPSWFPDQLARVDQTVRIALSALRSYLSDLCYVGPKRSSVPRNLTENVLDEYANWGNGLGAWRWLLNRTQCPDTAFSKCSNWLSDPLHGLGTHYVLRRDGIIEMTPEQLHRHLESQLDLSELKHSMRIELLDTRSGTTRHPQEVGEGITQLVPVIAASVRTSESGGGGQLVAIEQPELHLHPSLAARIGDLLVSCAFGRGFSPVSLDPAFLIETHSEHLILRILRRIRQTTNGELPEHIPPVKSEDVCVLWVDNLGEGTTFQRLRIDEQGEFIDRWPKGFFRERSEELF